MRYRLGDGMVEPVYDASSGIMLPAGGPGGEFPEARPSQSDVRTVDNAIFKAQADAKVAKGAGLLIGAFLLAPLLLKGLRRKR